MHTETAQASGIGKGKWYLPLCQELTLIVLKRLDVRSLRQFSMTNRVHYHYIRDNLNELFSHLLGLYLPKNLPVNYYVHKAKLITLIQANDKLDRFCIQYCEAPNRTQRFYLQNHYQPIKIKEPYLKTPHPYIKNLYSIIRAKSIIIEHLLEGEMLKYSQFDYNFIARNKDLQPIELELGLIYGLYQTNNRYTTNVMFLLNQYFIQKVFAQRTCHRMI